MICAQCNSDWTMLDKWGNRFSCSNNCGSSIYIVTKEDLIKERKDFAKKIDESFFDNSDSSYELESFPKNKCRYCKKRVGKKGYKQSIKPAPLDELLHELPYVLPAIPITEVEYWICNHCLVECDSDCKKHGFS